MSWFKRRSTLPGPNVAPDWATAKSWLAWDAPRNLIVGESYRQDALVELAGPPRDRGYLLPVHVDVVREPSNDHDPNALRAEVAGKHVGYVAKELAAELAGPLDAAGCSHFSICGVIRGGWPTQPSLGAHVWFDRRISDGPEIEIDGPLGMVENWPPDEDESPSPPIDIDSRHTRHGANDPGMVRGKHFTEHVETVKQLRGAGNDREAERLLLELVDATEQESKADGLGVAPWYYEQLAIVYRKRGDTRQEVAILERFSREKHAPGVKPPQLLERLEKARAKLQRQSDVPWSQV